MFQTLQIQSNDTQGWKTNNPYFILEVAKAIQSNLNASISILSFNWNVVSKYTALLALKK